MISHDKWKSLGGDKCRFLRRLMDEAGHSGRRQILLIAQNEGTFLIIGAGMVSV